jgi:hypothetical protein
MNVDGGDAGAESGDGSAHPDGDVGMAEVKTDPDRVEVTHLKDLDQVLREGGLAGEVFNEEADAKGTGKGAKMLEGGLSMLDGAEGPAVVSLAEVDDEVAKGDLLGGFEGAFDLIHGGDAASFFRVQNVNSRSSGAAHFPIRE